MRKPPALTGGFFCLRSGVRCAFNKAHRPCRLYDWQAVLMMTPRSNYTLIRGLELHYMEWGEPGKPPLILWHGFARTSRDFDDLALALAPDWHIFAPDTPGRGLSQWSPDPLRDYNNGAFADLAAAFLDSLGLGAVDWVGTSMGGAIAIRA